eukprot:14429077-Alexandrium_andersonii.AAC.1
MPNTRGSNRRSNRNRRDYTRKPPLAPCASNSLGQAPSGNGSDKHGLARDEGYNRSDRKPAN